MATEAESAVPERELVLSCGHPGSEAQLVHPVQGSQTVWCLACMARVEVEIHGG